MVVLTVKAKKKKIAVVLLIVAAVIAGLFGIRALSGYLGRDQQESMPEFGETKEQRLAFAERFGWEADPEGEKVEPITIPSQFSEAYTAYNQLQIQAGFDLTPYRGMQAQEYSYPLLNGEAIGEGVYIRILTIDGQIVGADICLTENGGTVYSVAEDLGQSLQHATVEEPESSASGQEEQSLPEASSTISTVETGLPALDDSAWPID